MSQGSLLGESESFFFLFCSFNPRTSSLAGSFTPAHRRFNLASGAAGNQELLSFHRSFSKQTQIEKGFYDGT
jgi:hypothetical protein